MAFDLERKNTYNREYKKQLSTRQHKTYMDVYNKATWADPEKRATRQAARQTEEYKEYNKRHRSLPEVAHREKLRKRKADVHLAQTILYIMSIDELPGVYKIGRCSDLKRRRQELNKRHFFKVCILAEYPGCGHLELPTHDLLAPYRAKSEGSGCREWFKTSVEHIHNTIQSVINSNSASSSSIPAGVPFNKSRSS